MGVRIVGDGKMAAMYCSVTDWAFGPVFYEGNDGEPAEARLERFLRWLPKDARRFSDAELATKYEEFLSIK